MLSLHNQHGDDYRIPCNKYAFNGIIKCHDKKIWLLSNLSLTCLSYEWLSFKILKKAMTTEEQNNCTSRLQRKQ